MIKKIFFVFVLGLLVNALHAQNPVKWAYSVKDAGNGQADLVFDATIDEGWHTYSQFLDGNDGAVATTIIFQEGPHFKLVGKAKESGDQKTEYDEILRMTLTKFKHHVTYTQRVLIKDRSKPILSTVNYLVCNSVMCLPPRDVDHSLIVPAAKKKGSSSAPTKKKVPSQKKG